MNQHLTYGPGGVFITGATLSGANGLIADGAGVSFGGLADAGTISAINGTAVSFSSPIAVDPSAIHAATVAAPTAGATTLSISSALSASAVQPGMLVYGDGIPDGTTITSVAMDSSHNISSVTLSNATTTAVASFNILSVNKFDADRYQPASSNSIKPLGSLPGLMVGMTVSGDGIPAGTTITAIASDGTVTFSNNVNATSGFTASSQGALVGSDVINLAAPRTDLAVGMKVSGDGIPDGTTILAINGSQITLSNAVTSAASEAISNNSFVASFNKVLSTGSSSLTLTTVEGLRVGALLTGDDVPDNAVITGINPLTKTVTYTIDPNAAALTTGGSMNGLVSTGTAGSNGNNGKNGSMYSAVLHDGEGSPGTNGYGGGDGTGAAGGHGGNGGNGSSGLPYNADAIYGLSSATFGAVDGTLDAIADWADLNFARAAVKTASLVHAWLDVAIATTDLIKWNVDLANGTVGLGGDGGSGGDGGNGDTFFGGGAGGAGGNGGSGALSFTDGGEGGEGGQGGRGGFGAGGGAGGAGGDGGPHGASTDGNPGAGGIAGFGAGEGSNGDGLYGGGGSGFGGAIFVRKGGVLTITGNALFQNNTVLAGSSNNEGEAGESAGTDLFMMRGSTVTLSPGAGNLDVAGQVTATTMNVNGGLLHLGSGTSGGTISSDHLVINQGGILNGFGAVSGLTTIGGGSVGTLSPGNSPGVITFANLELQDHSLAVMEIEGAAGAGLPAADGGYDLVRVTGTFSIGPDSTLQIANSNGFELALGQAVRIFEFAPGSVSGHFGTVTSAFDQPVAYNIATGSVIGLGSYSASSFASAVAKTANEQAMLQQVHVSSADGVDQFYGGRLVELAAAALASGNASAVSEVFAKASPEGYAGLIDHVKLSMLDNLTDLGGYEVAEAPRFFMTGSISTSSAKNEKEAGYLRFKTRDNRFNIGVAADLPIARIQVSYGRSDGKVSSDLMRGNADGNQFSLGASAPIALSGDLRLQARAAYGDYNIDGTRGTNGGVATFKSVNGKSTIFGGGFEYYHVGKTLSLDLSTELLSVVNKVGGFTETGVSAVDALAVNRQRDSFTLLKTRAEAGYAFTQSVQGFLNLSLDHDMGSDPHDVSAHLVNEDVVLSVGNPGVTNTRFRAGAGTRINLGKNILWSLQGYAGNASSFGGQTGVRFTF